MAKSPITNIQNNIPIDSKFDDQMSHITELNMVFTLKRKGGNKDYTFSLRDWLHFKCDSKNTLAVPIRNHKIYSLYKWVKHQLKNKYSSETILYKLGYFKSYISFCDSNGFDPFTRIGYLSYMGNDGELWRQVSLASFKKHYIFQYEDGDELGITEKTAGGMKRTIDVLLNELGFDTNKFQNNLHRFFNCFEDSTNIYTSNELKLSLRRLNFYFTSLVIQLMDFKDKNPSARLPTCLEAEIDNVEGNSIYITCGNANNKGAGEYGYCHSSPFSQCMAAGYILFAYYTAFNTSSILDINHPITEVKLDKGNKTSEFIKIKAYKARASKEVEALFNSGGEKIEFDNTTGNAGFIIASLAKRKGRGIPDGLTFIKVMKFFSKKFCNHEYSRLFYQLNKKHKPEKINIGAATQHLSSCLGLYSDNRFYMIEHLISVFNEVLDKGAIKKFKKRTSLNTGFRFVEAKKIKLNKESKHSTVIRLAYLVLTCLSNIQLGGILMPLKYSDAKEGYININFLYENGNSGRIKIDSKHKTFFMELEKYSSQYISNSPQFFF